MDQSQATNDQIARDDAHLQSLGIKPELRRTLGFLSNFAIAFAFISVSTGSFGNFGVGIGLSGPVFFWTWLLVIGGQLLVALNFAELSSHFPVAGSIYQWSKRLSNRTLGWFTGWFYFWAQVVTVSAVAVIVGYVISGFHPDAQAFLDSPDPFGVTNMHIFISMTTLVITTLINAYGVRLLSIINNIGVGTEILGMLVFALVLLFFANNQPVDVLFSFEGTDLAQNGNLIGHAGPGPLHVDLHRLRLRHGRHVRRGDRRCRKAGAAWGAVIDPRLGGGWRGLPAWRDPRGSRHAGHDRRGAGWRLPDRDDRDQHPDARGACLGSASARSTCSSSSPRSSSARWRSRVRRAG